MASQSQRSYIHTKHALLVNVSFIIYLLCTVNFISTWFCLCLPFLFEISPAQIFCMAFLLAFTFGFPDVDGSLKFRFFPLRFSVRSLILLCSLNALKVSQWIHGNNHHFEIKFWLPLNISSVLSYCILMICLPLICGICGSTILTITSWLWDDLIYIVILVIQIHIVWMWKSRLTQHVDM